jgi:hypothetical protein
MMPGNVIFLDSWPVKWRIWHQPRHSAYRLRARFVREHVPKLCVTGTGHALAEPFRHALMVVLAEEDVDVLRYQPSRQLVIAILASVANPLLDPSRQFAVVAALRLRQAPFRLLEFPRMLDHLPI